MTMNLDGQEWEVVDVLVADDGRYGDLYLVTSTKGVNGVAKCVRKQPGAQRELLFGDWIRAGQHPNVIPVIDMGEHADHFVIVMPRATMSLKQFIDQHPRGVAFEEATKILGDLAEALASIDGEIVHRDLKPANILLHEGVWKLADFGVSRFIDASTATETRKGHFTSAYAAPEQWNHESTSSRTDVYAFGVVAYELIEGRRPFPGPDFREQHMKLAPPQMSSGTAKMRQLIIECLLKDSQTRPRPKVLRDRLDAATVDTEKHGTARLVALSALRTMRISTQQARLAAERDRTERLEVIAADAAAMLKPVWHSMRTELKDGAPEIVFDTVMGNAAPLFRARYDIATLEFDRVDPVEGWQGPFTAYAYSSITVEASRVGSSRRGRSHSLWYCDVDEKDRFAWYELAFRTPRARTDRPRLEPNAAPPWSAEEAFTRDAGTMTLAWPAQQLDLADPAEFVQRWIGWFADAAAGDLIPDAS